MLLGRILPLVTVLSLEAYRHGRINAVKGKTGDSRKLRLSLGCQLT